MCSGRRVEAGLLSVYLALGCSTFARVEECAGSFQGEITTIQIADKRSSAKWNLGSVLVREKKDSGSLEMSFAVTEKTIIFRRIGGFRVPASFQSLKKGQTGAGEVLRPCPDFLSGRGEGGRNCDRDGETFKLTP